MRRILGIDPGSRITGFGIIEVTGQKISYVESGCIRAGEGDFAQRLHTIYTSIVDVIGIYSPGEAAIERVFVHKNVDSALKLGQARGAAICALTSAGLPVSEYSPTEIKKATVGRGRAAKEQVQHMITALLQLPGTPQADAADALAVALCHSHTQQTLSAGGFGRRNLR